MNLPVVVTRGQLVDIGQVRDALNVIVDEPWSVLRPVRDVLLPLLVASHFLLAAAGALHRPVLIRLEIRVTGLQLVVESKEEFDVPSEDGALGAA